VDDGVRKFQRVVLEMEEQGSGSGGLDGVWGSERLVELGRVDALGCLVEKRAKLFRVMSPCAKVEEEVANDILVVFGSAVLKPKAADGSEDETFEYSRGMGGGRA
jgi:hypothetical protein